MYVRNSISRYACMNKYILKPPNENWKSMHCPSQPYPFKLFSFPKIIPIWNVKFFYLWEYRNKQQDRTWQRMCIEKLLPSFLKIWFFVTINPKSSKNFIKFSYRANKDWNSENRQAQNDTRNTLGIVYTWYN